MRHSASMSYLTFLLVVTWGKFRTRTCVNATVTLTSLLAVHFKLVKAIRYILTRVIYHTQVVSDSATNISSRSCHNRYPETHSYIYIEDAARLYKIQNQIKRRRMSKRTRTFKIMHYLFKLINLQIQWIDKITKSRFTQTVFHSNDAWPEASTSLISHDICDFNQVFQDMVYRILTNKTWAC